MSPNTDFRFLDWIDSEAFSLISLMLRVQAISGDELVNLASWPLERLLDYWRMTKENYLEAVNAAKRFETNNDVVKYTPEAKAEVLHLFSSNATQALSRNDNDLNHLASASLAVLKSIKTHREFIEVLRRMGKEGSSKGSLADLKNSYVNLVLRFLYRSSRAEETERWLLTLYI